MSTLGCERGGGGILKAYPAHEFNGLVVWSGGKIMAAASALKNK